MEQDISLEIESNHILHNLDMRFEFWCTKVTLKASYHYVEFKKYHKLRELSRDGNNFGNYFDEILSVVLGMWRLISAFKKLNLDLRKWVVAR